MSWLYHCFHFSMFEYFSTKKLKRNLIKPPKFHMIVTDPHPLGLLPWVSLWHRWRSSAYRRHTLPQALCTHCVWFWGVPPRAHVLNTWSPVCGATGMSWRRGLVEGRLLGKCPWRGQWDPVPFPCCLAVIKWVAFLYHHPLRWCSTSSQKTMEPTDHGLKSLKPWNKINPPSF